MYEYESKSKPVSVIGLFFFPVYWLLKWLELCVGRRDSRGEVAEEEGGGGGGGALASFLLSKCENLHFYLLIYLTDRALKQPSINKRHVGNE